KLYDEEVLIGSISNVTGMPLQYEEPSNTADMQADASHIAAGIAHRYVHGSRFSDIPTEQFSPQMVCIRPGRFLLGSPEHPAAPATRQYQLRRPLAVGVYPITVAQFRAMAPIAEVFRVGSAFKIFFADALPMTNIDWWQANQFCQALTAHVNAARQKAGLKKLAIADQYRLPTDDEWETFARAGGTTAYSFAPLQAPPCGYTDSPDPNWAYYDWRKSLGGSMIKPHHPTIPGEVGSIEPNFWGVCGCHGNVWEWTALRHDGQDLASLRGGYFKSPPGEILSSTVRLQTINYSQLGMIGFRLVRNLSDDEWGE
ncbi:MAG: hypothetical protein RL748_1354, partial [Pseudomonadota bacterium]